MQLVGRSWESSLGLLCCSSLGRRELSRSRQVYGAVLSKRQRLRARPAGKETSIHYGINSLFEKERRCGLISLGHSSIKRRVHGNPTREPGNYRILAAPPNCTYKSKCQRIARNTRISGSLSAPIALAHSHRCLAVRETVQ